MRSRAELERTDIAAHALEALRESRVEEVFLLGRRGPEQAAFTPGELKELGHLEDADPVVDPAALEGCAPGEPGGNLELLRSFAARPLRPGKKRLHLRFLVSPTAILADAGGGVAALELERNRLERRPDGSVVARGTGERERLEVALVLPAVGYAADPIPGVPHDAKARLIANRDGRVVDPATGQVVPGEYVVGWARTGPQGLIGEHKRASAQVVELMVADGAGLDARPLPPRAAIDALLRERGVKLVTFDDWKQLDEVEVARGARRGAPRDKIVDVSAMLEILGQG
jgi:ferredoxin--NADP+ reductase